MNFKRVIEAPILALLFLTIFVYAIFGVQNFFDFLSQNMKNSQLSASVLGPTQDFQLQNESPGVQVPAVAENAEPDISAESAISVRSDLYGAKNILFEKQSLEKLPIASLTKLMTAIVVLENYNLSDTGVVTVVADAQSPMKQDVKLGDVMSVQDFLDIMLVGSSNKSAYALADMIGVEKFVGLMNQKADDLGLKITHFKDPTGLSPENVSTAYELAQLAEYILNNYPQIAEVSKQKELYVPKFGNVINTDELLDEPLSAVFSKTGFTNEAKGCLLLVLKDSKSADYFINVILGANDRFSEMQKLISASQ